MAEFRHLDEFLGRLGALCRCLEKPLLISTAARPGFEPAGSLRRHAHVASEFLAPDLNFPVPSRNFPVPLSREFDGKCQENQGAMRLVRASLGRRFEKFPLLSLLNRNFGRDGFARDSLHRHFKDLAFTRFRTERERNPLFPAFANQLQTRRVSAVLG